MNMRIKTVLLAATAILALKGGTSPAMAATILVRTAGFADTTPDFYHVEFQGGGPGSSIASVTFTLSSGFFDFDGETSFMDATAPVLHLPSLSGLTSADITFSFAGDHPTSLTASFTPGSFGVGDSFRFAADADNLGSKLGGVFGAGATVAVTLASGLSGSAPFRTNTSVDSLATVTIDDPGVIPEPRSIVLFISGLAGLTAWRKRRSV
jgi:hypothetical protein